MRSYDWEGTHLSASSDHLVSKIFASSNFSPSLVSPWWIFFSVRSDSSVTSLVQDHETRSSCFGALVVKFFPRAESSSNNTAMRTNTPLAT